MIDSVLIVELLALGLVCGFLAGLLGIGGGMLMVPFLTLILSQRGVDAGMAVKMAIATSMATIMFTSIASVRAHHQRGAVRWDLVRGLAPGILIGGLLAGAGIFALLKGAWLAEKLTKPAASRQMPGTAGQVGAGTGIGLLSGLVGAGGGFVSVPFMTWCNVPMHKAVATSAALGFPIAVASTTGYLIGGWSLPTTLPGSFGYLYLPALVVIACASVTMAPLGVRTAHAMDVAQLKKVFASLLFLLAAYMLYKGLAG